MCSGLQTNLNLLYLHPLLHQRLVDPILAFLPGIRQGLAGFLQISFGTILVLGASLQILPDTPHFVSEVANFVFEGLLLLRIVRQGRLLFNGNAVPPGLVKVGLEGRYFAFVGLLRQSDLLPEVGILINGRLHPLLHLSTVILVGRAALDVSVELQPEPIPVVGQRAAFSVKFVPLGGKLLHLGDEILLVRFQIGNGAC